MWGSNVKKYFGMMMMKKIENMLVGVFFNLKFFLIFIWNCFFIVVLDVYVIIGFEFLEELGVE